MSPINENTPPEISSNYDQFLDDVVKVFWLQGFKHTTFEDIADALDVSEDYLQSTYPTTQALYREALDNHFIKYDRQFSTIFAMNSNFISAMRCALYESIEIFNSEDEREKVLETLKLTSLPQEDELLANELVRLRNRIATRITEKITQFNVDFEDNVDVSSLARFYLGVVQGLAIQTRDGYPKEDLFKNIRLTVAETQERKFKDLRPRFKALRNDVSEQYPITKVNLDWI